MNLFTKFILQRGMGRSQIQENRILKNNSLNIGVLTLNVVQNNKVENFLNKIAFDKFFVGSLFISLNCNLSIAILTDGLIFSENNVY